MGPNIRIHPTAIIEDGVQIGAGTSIWDNVHIRSGAVIGENCIIGEKTYIAGDAVIGNMCKINASVYIPAYVTIEDGVMIAAHTVFTNDQFPRACTPDLSRLLPSAPDEHTRRTLVRAGATIGANCTIGNNLVIGRFAMVGMGAVVTRTIQDFQLVIGCPARPVGYVCRCGHPLGLPERSERRVEIECTQCGWHYSFDGGFLADLGQVALASSQ